MDFWTDIAFAVLLRLLKDRRERTRYTKAIKKIYDAIGDAFNPLDHHTFPAGEESSK